MTRIARTFASIFLLAALSASAHAQLPADVVDEGRPAVPFSQDFHAFYFLFNQHKCELLRSVDDLVEKPEETVLIVLGDTRVLEDVAATFRNFVEKGGSVLIASDKPSTPVIERTLWLKISIEDVPVTATEEENAYRGLRQCPVIGTRPEDGLLNPDLRLFKGLAGKGIATNLPAYVHWTDQFVVKLRPHFPAMYPPSCKINPWLATGEPMPMRLSFAAANEVYGGRILVLADHSVFINCMMIQDDNDNFQFANNCVNWLTKDGARKRVLILNDGQPITNLDPNLPGTLPNLDIDPVTKVNELLSGWQDKDLFNETILSFFSLEQILSLLALLVTAAVLVYGFFRLAKARHQQA